MEFETGQYYYEQEFQLEHEYTGPPSLRHSTSHPFPSERKIEKDKKEREKDTNNKKNLKGNFIVFYVETPTTYTENSD